MFHGKSSAVPVAVLMPRGAERCLIWALSEQSHSAGGEAGEERGAGRAHRAALALWSFIRYLLCCYGGSSHICDRHRVTTLLSGFGSSSTGTGTEVCWLMTLPVTCRATQQQDPPECALQLAMASNGLRSPPEAFGKVPKETPRFLCACNLLGRH